MNLSSIFEKIKNHKKLTLGAIGALIVASIGWNIFQSQPQSIGSIVEPSFSGYDGYGVLDLNYADIDKKIAQLSYKKAGLSSKHAEGLANQDPIISAEIYNDTALAAKASKAAAMISSVQYSFDKTSDLKNNDTVVLTVKTTSSESPVKKEVKNFTVKGLNEVQKISTQDFLKEYPVEFVGFNNYGGLKLPKDEYDNDLLINENNKSKLQNGDKVTLTVSPTYLEKLKEDGKALEAKTIELEVSGLKEITEISNLADALGKNETYAKSQHENSSSTQYTLEKQKSYIANYNDSYGYNYDADSSSNQVNLITVFKITTASEYSDTRVEYAYYGYSYYVKSDNTLDLETANKISGSYTQDLENLTAELDTDGYKEYTVAE